MFTPDHLILYGYMFKLPHFREKFLAACNRYDPAYDENYIRVSELAEKLEADFYSQDIGSHKPGSVPAKENLPDASQITPEVMLTVVRQMNPEQRREFTRLLFA